jgi:hypothetical protein
MNSHIQKLIATLKQLPPEWPLVPSRYKKPLGYFWQERPFTPRQLIQGLLAGGITVVNKNRQPYQVLPTGFGLLTGYPLKDGDQTYYLMALDQDGPSAAAKILELSQGAKLPHTVTFTSGRSFRCQYLFAISADDASQLETRKINTGKDEALELRWKGCQSILPPSLHPTNGQYQWCEGCSVTTAVAHAPEWLLKLMHSHEAKRSNYKPTKTTSCLGKPYRKQQRLPSFQIHPTTANKARKL